MGQWQTWRRFWPQPLQPQVTGRAGSAVPGTPASDCIRSSQTGGGEAGGRPRASGFAGSRRQTRPPAQRLECARPPGLVDGDQDASEPGEPSETSGACAGMCRRVRACAPVCSRVPARAACA